MLICVNKRCFQSRALRALIYYLWLKCSDGKRFRLNSEAKGKVLFYKKQDNVIWLDDELYSLIPFMMLFTDGKAWVAHKNSKFWEVARKFVQQRSCTAHCRTGKTILVH